MIYVWIADIKKNVNNMLKWKQEDKEKTKQTKLNNKILKITSPQINT